jgi:hypothetical protein
MGSLSDFIKEMTPGGVGIWVLVFGLFGAMVRAWPALKKLANERETGALASRAEDMDDMRKRIGELETKVERANDDATIAKDSANIVRMQMVSMQAAFELVAGELERADPENMVLQHARRLLAQAATSDMGVGVGLRKLAVIKGVGEI